MRNYRKFIIEKFEFILGILVVFAFCTLIILSQVYNLDNFSNKNKNLIKNEIYEQDQQYWL